MMMQYNKNEILNYKRPNISSEIKKIERNLKFIVDLYDKKEKINLINNTMEILNTLKTSRQICYIRYYSSGFDKKKESEILFWNKYDEIIDRYDYILLDYLIKYKMCNLKISNESEDNGLSKPKIKQIKKLITAEEKLIKRYNEIINNSCISFMGKKLKLKDISNNTQFTDKQKSDIKYLFYENLYYELSDIVVSLIQVRQKISIITNEDVYCRFHTFDCTSKQKYRNEIFRVLTLLYDEFAKKYSSKVSFTNYYSNKIIFYDDKYDEKKFESCMKRINNNYYKLYNKMKYNGCLNLENNLNISYSTYLISKKIPYIIFNKLRTFDDFLYLSHEMGHCIQFDTAANKLNMEQVIFPELDVSEIFSQLCEKYFAYFVTNKKVRLHCIEMEFEKLLFYCLLDEFQDTIYSMKIITLEKIEQLWKKLYLRYFKNFNLSGCDFLQNWKSWILDKQMFIHPYYSTNYFISDLVALADFVNFSNNTMDNLVHNIEEWDIYDYLNYEKITVDNLYDFIVKFVKKIESGGKNEL